MGTEIDPEFAARISEPLQQLENWLREQGLEETAILPRILFPRGVIRTVEHYKRIYPCSDEVIATNAAYTLQFHDVLRWILNRTDLSHSAHQMVVKYGIIAITSVIEGLLEGALQDRGIKRGNKLSSKLRAAYDHGLIDDELYYRLDEVRGARDKIHLHLYRIKGRESYDVADWDAAVAALKELAAQLGRP